MIKIYKFLIYLYLVQNISSQFIFPFKRKIISPSSENFIDYLLDNEIETELKVGNPPQNIVFNIKLYEHAFYISPIEKGGKYDYKASNSYLNHSQNQYSYGQQCLYDGFEGSESFNFKSINNKDKNLNNITFILSNEYNGEYCVRLSNAQLGLTFISSSLYSNSNVINILNHKKILDSYAFHFNFSKNKNEKDYLIIGGYPHEYDTETYEEKFLKTDSIEELNFWTLTMKVVIQNQTFFDSYLKLDVSNKGIEGTTAYQRIIDTVFFQDLINKTLCQKVLASFDFNDYFYYTCNNNVNLTKFPPIYFTSSSMNYTFNLTYEDLFISLNDKYYFLVIFHKKFYGDWVLGEPFLKKYNIIFDQKSETISFYTQSNIKKKEDTPRKENKFLIILVIIFFVSTIILSFLLYLCIKKIPRKKRANELEENFDYVSKEFPQKTDYQKLLN